MRKPSKPKKIKHKSATKLHKKAWELESKFKRREAADEHGIVCCYTCDHPHYFTDMDLGHYIHLNALDFEPDNLRVQCKQCNKWKSGNGNVYAERIVKEIGIERVNRLRDLEREYKTHPKQFKIAELEEIITTYQDLLKTLGK